AYLTPLHEQRPFLPQSPLQHPTKNKKPKKASQNHPDSENTLSTKLPISILYRFNTFFQTPYSKEPYSRRQSPCWPGPGVFQPTRRSWLSVPSLYWSLFRACRNRGHTKHCLRLSGTGARIVGCGTWSAP